jgi:hypothetical protein
LTPKPMRRVMQRHFSGLGEAMPNCRFSLLVIAAVTVTSCSSRPREFTAELKAPAADEAQFAQTHETCRVQVAQGKRSGFGGQLASGAAGTAAAVGTGAAIVGSAGPGMFAGAAAGAMAVMVMPVVGIGAAWGLAKAKKAKKERDVKQAMALCLSENGYAVDDWKKASRQERKARRAADKARRKAAKAVAAVAAAPDQPPPAEAPPPQ